MHRRPGPRRGLRVLLAAGLVGLCLMGLQAATVPSAMPSVMSLTAVD